VAGLWSELGKKLADRWLTLLVLPGVLYIAALIVAHALGQSHALSGAQLVRQLRAYAKGSVVTTLYGQILVLVGVLVAAAAIGLAAQAIGTLIEHLALSAGWQAWPSPLRQVAEWRIRDRQKRWDTEDGAYWAEYHKAMDPDPTQRPHSGLRHRSAHRRARIALERPERPTWSGDRLHAVAIRLDRDLSIDLATIWPYLWLTYHETVQTELTTARTALTRATMLGAWSIMYAPLTWWWWPAAPLAVILAATASYRMRAATDSYARLLEAATRLHIADLASHLGFDRAGTVTRHLGDALTHYLGGQASPTTMKSE
jgi:hypothetical protein